MSHHRRIKGAALLATGFMAACGLSAAPVRAAPVNLVQNGDFTAVALSSPGGYLCNQTSNTACGSRLTAWSATCSPTGCLGGGTPASILFPGSNGSAFNGTNGLYSAADSPLGGNTFADDGDPTYSAAISQTITGLVPGDTYSLTFYQAAAQQRNTSGATKEQWQVTLGTDQQTSSLMNNANHGFVAWNQQVMTYTATLASEVLTFLSKGTPAGEPPVVLLANVSLTDVTPAPASVPEPGTLLLVGAGLLGLGQARRSRLRARPAH